MCAGRGISIAALEKAVGLANGTIGRWDRSSPTVANAKKVADFFGCKIDDLLGG